VKGIYAILDENNFDYSRLNSIVKMMIDNNIKIFQIRIKSSFTNTKIKVISEINSICKERNCKLILNDNVEITKELDLDGVHIGLNDINLSKAREYLGNEKIIGVSCYDSLDDAFSAQKNHASYVSFGSLYKTSTKINAKKLNLDTFLKAKNVLSIPICLIGGINSQNLINVLKLNSDLIAISKGLSSNSNIKKISKIFYEKKY
tara:strand:+ start:154 stop:765 length:612 start_codon:yes stop_codon:yes gene_type:complete